MELREAEKKQRTNERWKKKCATLQNVWKTVENVQEKKHHSNYMEYGDSEKKPTRTIATTTQAAARQQQQREKCCFLFLARFLLLFSYYSFFNLNFRICYVSRCWYPISHHCTYRLLCMWRIYDASLLSFSHSVDVMCLANMRECVYVYGLISKCVCAFVDVVVAVHFPHTPLTLHTTGSNSGNARMIQFDNEWTFKKTTNMGCLLASTPFVCIIFVNIIVIAVAAIADFGSF